MAETVTKAKTERSAVQNAILALLSHCHRHGYELRELFQAALGGHWELNSGQVYSSLERLERDGLVAPGGTEKGGGPEKRLWTLTRQGEEELASWFNSPVPRNYRLRDELHLKLMLALVMRSTQGRQILIVQRRALFQELHDLTARRNLLDPQQHLARILLLDSAIMHTEAELRWLDIIEARLDDIREQPPPKPLPRPRGRPRKKRALYSE